MKKRSLMAGAAALGLSTAFLIFHLYGLSSVAYFARIQALKRWALRPRITMASWPPASRLAGIACNRTDPRYDLCFVEGPNLLEPTSATVYLVDPATYRGLPVALKTRPYTRKRDLAAMKHVKEITLTSARHAKKCSVTHTRPALVFSAGGYTGNFFHDFNDGLLPLFITIESYFPDRDFHLVVANQPGWWANKYKEVLLRISSHRIIDLDRDNMTHCFPRTTVGLIKHGPMTVDPTRLARPLTLLSFSSFLEDAYLRSQVTNMHHIISSTRPKLVLLSRARQDGRAIINMEELIVFAKQVGFDVTLFEPSDKTPLRDAFRLIHSSQVMVGVHGAGLTHSLFLCQGSVFIQVVPVAMEWVSKAFFGDPAKELGLEYIEYKIDPSESTLAEQFGVDHVVLKNPNAITKGNWGNMKMYLTQNMKLDMVRFRPCLEEAFVKAKSYIERDKLLVASSRKLIK